MLIDHIKNCRKKQLEKGWKKLFWAIDLHGTIIPPSHNFQDKKEFLGIGPDVTYCEAALIEISQRNDQCIILWTATDTSRIWNDIVPWLDWHSIKVKYHNENPECQSEAYARFTGKFYFDILIDDKAGFDVSWWKSIYEEVRGW